MMLDLCEQRTIEWFKLKAGKVSGTRFGQLLSNRKNRLVYELVNEVFNGTCDDENYISDDMQFGIDNEPIALELYTEQTGIAIDRPGAILSESCSIHMHSPDGVSIDHDIIQEVKCTQNGAIHIQRYFEGPETQYRGQIANCFAIAPEVKQVHFISYCPDRVEKPMFFKVLERGDYEVDIKIGLKKLADIENKLNKLVQEYSF